MKKIISTLIMVAMLMSSFATISVFADTEPVQVNSAERLYVDLINNKTQTGNEMFTQDHATNDTYDYDRVMLARFKISNIQATGSMEFAIKLASSKPTTSKAKFFLVDNNWTSSSFEAVKAKEQTELFTSKTMDNYVKDGSYYDVSFVLTNEQIEAIKAASDDEGYFTILVRGINTKANRTDITTTIGSYTANANNNRTFYVNVTYATQDAKFYYEQPQEVTGTDLVAIKYSNPSVNEAITTANKTFYMTWDAENGGYGCVFAKFNLADIDLSKVTSVKFSGTGYCNGAVNYSVYAVTKSWDSTNGSYTIAETPITSKYFKFTTSTMEFDVTDYFKSLDSSVTEVELCLAPMATETTVKKNSIYVGQNANIKLVLNVRDEVTGSSAITTEGNLTAERFVVAGSTDAPVNAFPILAVFDNDILSSVQVGNSVTLDGTPQKISVSVPVEDGLAAPNASLFIWTSLQELVPVLDVNSIR